MRCYSCRKYDDCERPWKCDGKMYDCTAYELEQTNEEYLKSCTTEMLAVAIFKALCISAEMIHCEITLENRSGTELKEAIYEWLKQPHKE